MNGVRATALRARGLGRCAACAKPISGGHEFVHLYGERVHRDCALYRARRTARR